MVGCDKTPPVAIVAQGVFGLFLPRNFCHPPTLSCGGVSAPRRGLCRERHDPPAVYPIVAWEHDEAKNLRSEFLLLHAPGPMSRSPIMLQVTEGGQT